MKNKSKKINILIYILLIFVTLTLSSCNKKENPDTIKVNDTSETIEEKEITEENNTLDIEEEVTVFDESELGYSIKEDTVFLNDKPLPTTSKVSKTTREADKTTYHFYDGAALIIKSNGDIIVDFPIRITLLIDKDFTTFETLYNGNPLTNATITNFLTEDNWYTIDYGNNTSLKFNNETLIFNTNNLEIIKENNSCETIFKDFIISESSIATTDALSNIIKIDYEDGNQLTHIVGGATTFIFSETNTSIESDGQTTKITKDDDETIISGEITNIDFNKETGSIVFETTEEKVVIDTSGEVIEKEIIQPTEEEIISEEPPKEDIEDLNNQEILSEEEKFDPESNKEEPPQANDLENENEDAGIPIGATVSNDFEQDTIGEWGDENEEIFPYRIGVIPAFTFMQINSSSSNYGVRADLVVENEIVPGTVIGLEVGLGFDHIDSLGNYKNIVTNTTFAKEFTNDYSKITYFIKAKFGSLIPLQETIDDEEETPYIRLGLGLGFDFNIDDHWRVRVGAEGAVNYSSDFVYTESGYIGLIYKFQ
ncbi:MAG: hypothetical protein ACPKM0_01985 [Pleomorphochaeta sp.]